LSGDPGLAARLKAKLALPVTAGQIFIASTPAPVVAQQRGGIVGGMPAMAWSLARSLTFPPSTLVLLSRPDVGPRWLGFGVTRRHAI
jgi:hypothetical protein